MIHLINETARHAGHADATRELLDWRPTGPDLLTELGDDRLYNL